MKTLFKTPLAVYIIWHHKFLAGQEIADSIYSILSRDSSRPLIRSMGIPTYFRSVNEAGKTHPIRIDLNESEFTAVIPLITDDFVIDRGLAAFVDDLIDHGSKSNYKCRTYPVGISKHASKTSEKLGALNFIPIRSKKRVANDIIGPILHELCRLLLNMKSAIDENVSLRNSPPIRLFISHSKHDDSKTDAIKFRDYINSHTQLKTFFDTTDIRYGSNFGDEIKQAAKESALVVFQSDSYADREWCRIEVLEAKTAGCPIVVVNAVQSREQRAFPYLGNFPSIRLNNNYSEIVDLTLQQVLYNTYTKLLIDSITDLYDIKAANILSSSPELFNFIQLKQSALSSKQSFHLILYPDPPIGTEEMEVLNKFDDNYMFITPSILPSLYARK